MVEVEKEGKRIQAMERSEGYACGVMHMSSEIRFFLIVHGI